MDDDAFYHRPAAAGFGFQFGQLPLGHFAVGFVVERDSLPAVGEFAGRAEEQHDGAGFGVAGAVDEGGGVDGVVGELDHVDVTSALSSAAASRKPAASRLDV